MNNINIWLKATVIEEDNVGVKIETQYKGCGSNKRLIAAMLISLLDDFSEDGLENVVQLFKSFLEMYNFKHGMKDGK